MSGLIVTPAPHIKSKNQIGFDMRDVFIALFPAFIMGIVLFGPQALIVILSAMISAVLFEIGILKLRKKPINKFDIGSSALTGMLLAFCVSSYMPWWAMVAGSFVAIVVAKHMFGGLGFNIFNPALVGRAFLTASWPVVMTTWLLPFSATTGATPLMALKEHGIYSSKLALMLGNRAGSIGETSAILLILGGIYLLWRGTIDYRIPVSFIGTVALMSLIFRVDVGFHVLAGGLMLGAFYMATDPVTSPVTKPGRWIFGIGCGIITMVIRLWGGYPEGVCYSILIMNAAVPLIDRYLMGRILGRKRWVTL